MKRVAVTALLIGCIALPAAAQAPTPDSENGRYTFSQTPEGVLRLDSRTGQVSLCSKRPAGWACQAVPDERAALEAEIALLQNQNVALKKEMIARGLALPSGMKAPDVVAEKKGDELVIKLPNDQDLDRVMTFMEKIWRRLIDMVQSVQRDVEKKG